jgi:hypothetical protein
VCSQSGACKQVLHQPHHQQQYPPRTSVADMSGSAASSSTISGRCFAQNTQSIAALPVPTQTTLKSLLWPPMPFDAARELPLAVETSLVLPPALLLLELLLVVAEMLLPRLPQVAPCCSSLLPLPLVQLLPASLVLLCCSPPDGPPRSDVTVAWSFCVLST